MQRKETDILVLFLGHDRAPYDKVLIPIRKAMLWGMLWSAMGMGVDMLLFFAALQVQS